MTDTEARRPTVQFGPDTLVVTDPGNVLPVAAEIITEVRLMNGVFAISFASGIVDGNGVPEARVCARLRLTPEVVAGLQATLSEMLENAAKAKQAAN